MAVRKSTSQAQLIEALSGVLQPGEQIVSAVQSVGGRAPVLKMAMFGAIWMRYFYVAFTDRRVFILKTKASGRPGEVLVSQSRAETTVSAFRRRPLWSSFVVEGPQIGKRLQINVHRMWREEFDQLANAVGMASA